MTANKILGATQQLCFSVILSVMCRWVFVLTRCRWATPETLALCLKAHCFVTDTVSGVCQSKSREHGVRETGLYRFCSLFWKQTGFFAWTMITLQSGMIQVIMSCAFSGLQHLTFELGQEWNHIWLILLCMVGISYIRSALILRALGLNLDLLLRSFFFLRCLQYFFDVANIRFMQKKISCQTLHATRCHTKGTPHNYVSLYSFISELKSSGRRQRVRRKGVKNWGCVWSNGCFFGQGCVWMWSQSQEWWDHDMNDFRETHLVQNFVISGVTRCEYKLVIVGTNIINLFLVSWLKWVMYCCVVSFSR